MTLTPQKQLDQLLLSLKKEGNVPSLFLHSCCAPCSTYVIEYLSEYFYITVFYFNPNISPQEEYAFRAQEQKRFISQFPTTYPVTFVEGDYNPSQFEEMAKGLEEEPEGGIRCEGCFNLRLGETARQAKLHDADYFATTLTISPLKNVEMINDVGMKLQKQFGVTYLPSEFRKKNGFLRSTQLSNEYEMYRQDYCGCRFSKR